MDTEFDMTQKEYDIFGFECLNGGVREREQRSAVRGFNKYNALDNEHMAHECSEAFSTNEVFRDRDELLDWARSVGYKETMVGHPYAGRLSIEEKVMVEDMSKTAVKPRNILLTMKERNEKNVTTIKQVYNACNHCSPKITTRSQNRNATSNVVTRARQQHKKENNFFWALDRLKGLFLRVDSCPRVVVCDRDVALMNAIRMVFPEAYNLLCRFHIDKNVKAKCKMLVHPREAWDQVMEVWGSVVDCDIVEAFEDRVNAFRVVCSPWPIFVDYVMDTWLRPHKEKFVKAWIDKVTAYKKLLGFVSKYALNVISEELDRVKSVGFDKSRCGCSLTCTHGLPCACQLASFGVGSIPLKSIHVMWTRLSFEDIATEQSSTELSIDKEFEVIAKRFKELDVAGKVNIKSKLQDIAFPEKTSIYAPDHKVKTKGAVKMSRPTKFMRKRIPSYFEHVDFLHSQHDSCASKKSNEESLPEIVPAKYIPFLDQFPVGYHPYIVDVVDVKADGHCGYRAVAAQLGMGEESWAVVRMNLLKELSEWRQEYVQLFGGDDRYEYLKKSLLVEHMSMAVTDKWMTIPNMGYVIANRYNVILVSLSMLQSLSIFPLRTQAPSNFRQHRIIAIGHVHRNHFVQVKLKDGCPIPPTDILWASHRYLAAQTWSTYYTSRIQVYTQLMSIRRYL
ncbi:uncharacterized protein [Phaseolus vulgaris]|uniref:uncharacterized protein n=1 Tax=Phaseolus vulgaris TaxID=3885 RepID=UPI0035CBCC4C